MSIVLQWILFYFLLPRFILKLEDHMQIIANSYVKACVAFINTFIIVIMMEMLGEF